MTPSRRGPAAMRLAPCAVAALQLPHAHGDVLAQLELVDDLLQQTPGLSLALLPEASLTGYVSRDGDFDLSPLAEPLDGPTATRLAALARKHSLALAGPLIERDGDRLYNSTLVFDRTGRRLAHYRKRHPWLPETWATPGEPPLSLFSLGGLTFAIAVCYDVHFLRDESAAELEQADVLLFASAWCERDGDQRDALLPELAREFSLTIVNANWGPGVPRVHGQGASRIVGPDGRERARLGFEAPAALTVALDADTIVKPAR